MSVSVISYVQPRSTVRLITLLGFAVLGLVASGCTKCSPQRDFDSYVNVPLTIASAERRHAPPDTVVTIKQGAREETGGVKCAHSPLCIILLPLVIGDLVSPPHYQEVTIKEQGEETYRGVYRANGEFVSALMKDGGGQRTVQMIPLVVLERNIVVEVGRAGILPDGTVGPYQKTSIEQQVELLAHYRRILDDVHHWQRLEAAVEVLFVLGSEAYPLISQVIAKQTELPEFKAGLFEHICSPVSGDKPEREFVDSLVHRLIDSNPGPLPLLGALRCYSPDRREPIKSSLPTLSDPALPLATLRAICAEDSPDNTSQVRAFSDWLRGERTSLEPEWQANRELLGPMEKACAVETELYVKFMLGERLGSQEILRIFQEDRFRADVLKHLNPQFTNDHESLLALLSELNEDELLLVLPQLETQAIIPTSSEIEFLVDSLSTKTMQARVQAFAISRIVRSSQEQRARARSSLAKPLEELEDKYQVAVLSVLVALGDWKSQIPLARRIIGAENIPPVVQPHEVYSQEQLAAYAFGLAGCGKDLQERIEKLHTSPSMREICGPHVGRVRR